MSVCLALGGACWYSIWTSVGEPFLEEYEFSQSEALEFARGRSQRDCVEEALNRAEHCGGAACAMHVQTFVRACAENATRSPRLCASVPSTDTPLEQWPVVTCAGEIDPQLCASIHWAVASACEAQAGAP